VASAYRIYWPRTEDQGKPHKGKKVHSRLADSGTPDKEKMSSFAGAVRPSVLSLEARASL